MKDEFKRAVRDAVHEFALDVCDGLMRIAQRLSDMDEAFEDADERTMLKGGNALRDRVVRLRNDIMEGRIGNLPKIVQDAGEPRPAEVLETTPGPEVVDMAMDANAAMRGAFRKANPCS